MQGYLLTMEFLCFASFVLFIGFKLVTKFQWLILCCCQKQSKKKEDTAWPQQHQSNPLSKSNPTKRTILFPHI
jgi:hypothetical protein